MKTQDWYVYIIKATDDTLYTGITTDVLRRWKEHSLNKGAKYFRGRKPEELLYVESSFSRSKASQREYQIKKLTKKNKLLLMKNERNKAELYASKVGLV